MEASVAQIARRVVKQLKEEKVKWCKGIMNGNDSLAPMTCAMGHVRIAILGRDDFLELDIFNYFNGLRKSKAFASLIHFNDCDGTTKEDVIRFFTNISKNSKYSKVFFKVHDGFFE